MQLLPFRATSTLLLSLFNLLQTYLHHRVFPIFFPLVSSINLTPTSPKSLTHSLWIKERSLLPPNKGSYVSVKAFQFVHIREELCLIHMLFFFPSSYSCCLLSALSQECMNFPCNTLLVQMTLLMVTHFPAGGCCKSTFTQNDFSLSLLCVHKLKSLNRCLTVWF